MRPGTMPAANRGAGPMRRIGRPTAQASRPRRLSPAAYATFKVAVRHHQDGNLLQAESLYRQVLATHAGHADALHLLGLLALQVGRADLAIELIEQAIGSDACVPLYHTNLGNALKAVGRLDDAVACYRAALAIEPDGAAALNNLGATLHAQHRLVEAEACLRQALTLRPDGPETHNNLGAVLADQGRTDAAIDNYRQAIALWPSDPRAHNNLGAALKDQGEFEAAVRSYRRAIALRPDFAAAHANLGIALRRLGRLPEADACCRKALAHQPDLLEAHDTLGATLAERGRLTEAAACYRRAIALRPNEARLHDNLGTVLKAQGLLDAAVISFRSAVGRLPDFANAHHNLGMALLARGDMAEGWREYEWRWRTEPLVEARRRFTQPQWRGEPAAGRTLLIHAEQGFGDTIQFCRYARLAAEQGLRVIMQVPQPLRRLLTGLEGVDQVVADGEVRPPFDLHCPMLSLPLALGTTLATIPSVRLRADPMLVLAWGQRFDAVGRQGMRVGLTWAGNPAMSRDGERSLAPEHLAPLLDLPEIHFVSLQKDAAAHRLPLTGPMPAVGDFADTAGLIANLDLVIAVDTAVAHVAASLGKPVWLLDRFDPDWRWLVGRRSSPWYPTLRLYRQPQAGDWNSVLTEVLQDLRRAVVARHP